MTQVSALPPGRGPDQDRDLTPAEAASQGALGGEPTEAHRGLNNPVQIEQDSRNDKARAEAKAAGRGPDVPEADLNQDG